MATDAGAIRAARAEVLATMDRHGEEATLEGIRRVLSAKRRTLSKASPERAELTALDMRAAGRLGRLRREVADVDDTADYDSDSAPWD
jgi:hypothetical protein